MNNQWIERLKFIENDIENIMNLTKHSVLLRDFCASITTLNNYLDEVAILDRAIKKTTESWKIQHNAFVVRVAEDINLLKTSIDIVEKRKIIIEKIANSMAKKTNGLKNNCKKTPKYVCETKKIAIPSITSENTNIDYAISALNEKLHLEKQAQQLAKQKEKMEKQLAKQKEKMEKQLAKQKEKMEKQLAKQNEKMEKQQAKLLAKELKKIEKEKTRLAKEKTL